MTKLTCVCTGPYASRYSPSSYSILQLTMLGAFMRHWSIAIIAVASTVVFTPAASAADMPVKALPRVTAPPPVYNWTGFYVGGHVGYLWGRTHVEEEGVVIEDGAATNGVIGGALAGYNWQYNQFVFGLEGDFGWTNANGTGLAVVIPTTTQPNTHDFNWTSHVRGRFGYAADRWLFFVAGGLAIADFNFHEGATTTTTIPPGPPTWDGRSAEASNMPLRKISWVGSNICTIILVTRIISAATATLIAYR